MVDSFIPQIRFKMCKNQWEKNKLSKLAKFNPKSTLPEKFKYVDLESVIGTDLISYREVSRENAPSRAQRLAQKGDIFYQTVRPYQKNNYLFDSNEKDYVFSTGYAQLRPLIDSAFLLARLQEESFVNMVLERCTGTSYPAINSKDLSKISVTIPQTIEEQSAIGSLFRTLDDLLTSYKENLVNYQSLKATMLSKMFPKAGQTVPEIRLDGFEGEWEVVNLGTLIENYDEVISGTSGFPIATSSRKGLYLQNDYFEGGRTGIDLTLDFHRVPIGYVTYRHMSDDSIFKFNKNNFETDVLVSKEYPVFISNDSSDIDFLLYHLNNSRLFLRFSTMQKLGGTRVRLYYKNLITYKIAVPTVKEQQAIGTYFSNLDQLITSYQEKITQLETLKKKLLQNMFI
ncbi:restriction endonuclease subunit S [Streptococcus salivarius]